MLDKRQKTLQQISPKLSSSHTELSGWRNSLQVEGDTYIWAECLCRNVCSTNLKVIYCLFVSQKQVLLVLPMCEKIQPMSQKKTTHKKTATQTKMFWIDKEHYTCLLDFRVNCTFISFSSDSCLCLKSMLRSNLTRPPSGL